MYKIPQTVSNFHGEYFPLCNFYEHEIVHEGLVYQSSEAAFQAAKTMDASKRLDFCKVNPAESKKMGRALSLRPDWEQVKDSVMEEILLNKFRKSNPYLHQFLLNTGDLYLIEGNVWHDNYWGYCYCEKCKALTHRNQLGVALMKVRKYYVST